MIKKFSVIKNPVRQMASGVGASWHSILRPPVGHGGSAFGGTPPTVARHERAWETLEDAACWYGLKFLSAEFEWRQFEPEKGVYTWETGEMQVLRRILGWARRHGADVLLQHQWPGTTWNAFPEFRGDPAMKTYSAAFDLDAFAAGWARFHLHPLGLPHQRARVVVVASAANRPRPRRRGQGLTGLSRERRRDRPRG